ncbi:unnamed protein product [Darwinula stevensoni]|uniref:Uncharacterized protein n=1 Tax=Darwinula stevensoni TaxID=69355 RepID=A0A7R9A669_9CRUS|nr:unnamed protein product [Darwinula stevensoni]CAG0896052.1 unnamed protein product [Darwinula stevensoni]
MKKSMKKSLKKSMEFSRLFAVIVSALFLLMVQFTVGHPYRVDPNGLRFKRSAMPHADAHPYPYAYPFADAHPNALYGDPPGGRARKHNYPWTQRQNGERTA